MGVKEELENNPDDSFGKSIKFFHNFYNKKFRENGKSWNIQEKTSFFRRFFLKKINFDIKATCLKLPLGG